MNQRNKWDRRDHKRNAKRKMKVTGAGNKLVQRIIVERAEKLERQGTILP